MLPPELHNALFYVPLFFTHYRKTSVYGHDGFIYEAIDAINECFHICWHICWPILWSWSVHHIKDRKVSVGNLWRKPNTDSGRLRQMEHFFLVHNLNIFVFFPSFSLFFTLFVEKQERLVSSLLALKDTWVVNLETAAHCSLLRSNLPENTFFFTFHQFGRTWSCPLPSHQICGIYLLFNSNFSFYLRE